MAYYDPLLEEDDSNYNPILDLAFAFQKSRILLTAGELGIFSAIGEDAKTSEELSKEKNTNKDALDRLLNALASLNLLNKKEDRFSNTKVTLKYLVKHSGEYIGNARYANYTWNAWSNLTEAVITGKQPANITWDSDRLDAYIEFSELTSVGFAPDVIKVLGLENFNSILDLGAGSGYYAVEMLKTNPHLRITLLDYPQVISSAKNFMQKHIDIDRFKFIEADLLKDDIGSGYDMIFLANIAHFFPLMENIKLFTKIFRSLSYGGCVVIFDRILSDDRSTPIQSSILNLDMLLNSHGGACYTHTELWIMLKEAMFDNITKVDISPGYSVYFGYK